MKKNTEIEKFVKLLKQNVVFVVETNLKFSLSK